MQCQLAKPSVTRREDTSISRRQSKRENGGTSRKGKKRGWVRKNTQVGDKIRPRYLGHRRGIGPARSNCSQGMRGDSAGCFDAQDCKQHDPARLQWHQHHDHDPAAKQQVRAGGGHRPTRCRLPALLPHACGRSSRQHCCCYQRLTGSLTPISLSLSLAVWNHVSV